MNDGVTWNTDWGRMDNFGCTTSAELATLLGVGDIDGVLPNATDTNFNNLYGKTSFYRFNGYTGNIYAQASGYGLIKTTYTSVGYCEQTAYVINNNSAWFRTRTNSSGSWSPWSRIDNFGCNTAAELASVLEYTKPIKTLTYHGLYQGVTNPNKYIVITFEDSYCYYKVDLWKAGCLSQGCITVSGTSISSVLMKNIVGSIGDTKMYYDGKIAVIEISSSSNGTQTNLSISGDNKNLTIVGATTYDTSSMTQVTFG